jgi:hypothetical protein
MKTAAEIQIEIDRSRQLEPIYSYPQIIECWNEHEKMWRTDNGRSYPHILQNQEYDYHLLYLDGRLGIVERSGKTIFSHVTERILKIMSGDVSTLEPLQPSVLNQDRALVKFDLLEPDIQNIVKEKHHSFPPELQSKLDYRPNGNYVWSTETIGIARKYNLLK